MVSIYRYLTHCYINITEDPLGSIDDEALERRKDVMVVLACCTAITMQLLCLSFDIIKVASAPPPPKTKDETSGDVKTSGGTNGSIDGGDIANNDTKSTLNANASP